MDKTEQERCLRFCTDLSRMLEEEKTMVAGFLSGDIAEEYQKLLDSELEDWIRLKKRMGSKTIHILLWIVETGAVEKRLTDVSQRLLWTTL